MTPLAITIDAVKRTGERVPPRTKKNSAQLFPHVTRKLKDGRVIQAPLITPSPEYLEWHRAAVYSLKPYVMAWHRAGLLAIQSPVNCRALIYRERNVGDSLGYWQGLADFLEHNYAGKDEPPIQVVTNDKWIVTWDGSRCLKDAERPRIELVLEPAKVAAELAAAAGQGGLFE